ncbi:hypothetical protein ACFROC_27625 [Nocardia tengchongensis]|uniref:hypothetical protein n=1 Tax=Nocardia tengchongensis TaxID=2055889 RepID=UPI00368E89E6
MPAFRIALAHRGFHTIPPVIRWTFAEVPGSDVRLAAYGALQPEGLRLRAVVR